MDPDTRQRGMVEVKFTSVGCKTSLGANGLAEALCEAFRSPQSCGMLDDPPSSSRTNINIGSQHA